jgi:hypothetical protein
MPIQPQPRDETYDELVSDIETATEGRLSSFNRNDIETDLARSFSSLEVELTHYILSAWFATWIDYAGRELDADDLRAVGLSPRLVDLDILNAYVEPAALDRLVAGTVDRIPAKPATGEVSFFLSDPAAGRSEIPERTVVATGGGREYRTTASAPKRQRASTTAPVRAVEPGPDGNIPAGEISDFDSNQPGFDGVDAATNTEPIGGGEAEETTEELRARAKRSRTLGAGRVTAAGVKGRIITELPESGLEADDIAIIEFPDPTVSGAHPDYDGSDAASSPAVPHAIVIVDGGASDADVASAIKVAKEHAIPHPLERPTRTTLTIEGTLRPDEFATVADLTEPSSGDAAPIELAERSVLRYLGEKSLGENVSIDRLIADAIYAAPDVIEDLDNLSVTDETGTAITGDLSVSDREVVTAGSVTFTAGAGEI